MAEEYYYDEDTETAMEKVKRLFRENKVVAAGKSSSSPAYTHLRIYTSLTFYLVVECCRQGHSKEHTPFTITEQPSRARLLHNFADQQNTTKETTSLFLSLSLSFTPPLTPYTSLVSPIFSQ